MSRLGKIPIAIPDKVKVGVSGTTVNVEGPLGKLSWVHRPEVKVRIEENRIVVERASDEKVVKALHGTTRALVAAMVKGVAEGYSKDLDISGVGYNAKMVGDKLVLALGYSHPVEFQIQKGLTVTCSSATTINVKGADKQQVGQFAARVRAARPCEPYNQKGIKYRDEVVRKKAGKTFVTGAS
ncbi:MAG: 50S ribosomal protein L6 [Planctomycetes bacterium]|nr:50S ribosomal protein L6 [Planctomycetota bacterium]